MNKEQYSEVYIKGKLRDHKEYLGCEEHRRKQLITCDLYDLEQAFEDGWDESSKTIIDKACEWLKQNAKNYVVTCYDEGELNDEDLSNDFKKVMEE